MKTVTKLGLLGGLYFSQGLPFGFFTQALPVVLRTKGFTLEQIGLSSLLAIPWALKFLWAPVVDRHGARRTWIIPLQVLTVVVLAALGWLVELGSMKVLMTGVFLVNLLAATQDIATDGLAVDLLETGERGLANGLQVAGYRVGMIVGGGVLLIFADALGARGTFMAMAALTALASVPIVLTQTSPRRAVARAGRARHFLRRPGAAKVLTLLVTYKLGDAFGTSMLRPFLVDAGLTLADIGWLLGTVGFVSGLLGALAGGALVNRLGRLRSLLLFGALQAVTVGGYALMSRTTPSLTTLYLACSAEHFAGGMATAALFTCMMDWCAPESSATDYTVQASAVVVATGAAAALAGFSAQRLGYGAHFTLATALAFGALLAVRRCFPTETRSTSEVPSCA